MRSQESGIESRVNKSILTGNRHPWQIRRHAEDVWLHVLRYLGDTKILSAVRPKDCGVDRNPDAHIDLTLIPTNFHGERWLFKTYRLKRTVGIWSDAAEPHVARKECERREYALVKIVDRGHLVLPNVRGLPLRAADRVWKADTFPELAVVAGWPLPSRSFFYASYMR